MHFQNNGNQNWAPYTTSAADFSTSATKFRKELLRSVIRTLKDAIGPMATVRKGIRFKENLYDIDADVEFGAYNPHRKETVDPSIGGRQLETYWGSVWKEFDPNKMYRTILGSDETSGDALKTTEYTRLVLTILCARLSESLRKYLFKAKQVDKGKTSSTLFNGWDTQTAKEIAANKISVANGNLYEVPEAITSNNAVDIIKDYVRKASDILTSKQQVLLICPRWVYDCYVDDYQATVGSIQYNKEFLKRSVEGYENVIFHPMAEKRGSQYLNLTTKSNMLIGTNQMGNEEKILVDRFNPVMLSFWADMFFGTDFESIKDENLMIAKLYGAPVAPTIAKAEGNVTITGDAGSKIRYRIGAGKFIESASNTASFAAAEKVGEVVYAQAVKGDLESDAATYTVV